MARPQKGGVDYFSHDADSMSKKTIFTLENKFGNDGYAFWFKLLELLANKEGLYLDCRDPAEWLYLVAKTRVSEKTAKDILDTLARVDAIDPELWSQKVIWVQKFVDRLADVYRKRKAKTPEKPSFRSENPEGTDVSDAETPQSKVKESTVNKSTKEHVCSSGINKDDPGNLTQFHSDYPPEFEVFWQAYPKERRKEKKAAYRAWKARLNAGAKPEQLVTAARLYAQECKGKTPRFIKLAKTFLGSDCHWEEYQEPEFKHQHPLSDLQKVIERKTMRGIGGGEDP